MFSLWTQLRSGQLCNKALIDCWLSIAQRRPLYHSPARTVRSTPWRRQRSSWPTDLQRTSSWSVLPAAHIHTTLLTTREAAWYIISVVSACLSVCMYSVSHKNKMPLNILYWQVQTYTEFNVTEHTISLDVFWVIFANFVQIHCTVWKVFKFFYRAALYGTWCWRS